jgi:hypothetical protein
MSLSTKIVASITGTHTKSFSLDTSVSGAPKLEENFTLSDGTGDDQADKIYFTSGTLAASADIDIDLSGSLTDIYGQTVAFVTVKFFMVCNTSDEQDTPTDAIIQVGGGDGQDGTNAFDTWITSDTPGNAGSEAVKITDGGFIIIGSRNDGYAVTAATADLLTIKNLDGSDAASYEVMVIGTSA